MADHSAEDLRAGPLTLDRHKAESCGRLLTLPVPAAECRDCQCCGSSFALYSFPSAANHLLVLSLTFRAFDVVTLFAAFERLYAAERWCLGLGGGGGRDVRAVTGVNLCLCSVSAMPSDLAKFACLCEGMTGETKQLPPPLPREGIQSLQGSGRRAFIDLLV